MLVCSISQLGVISSASGRSNRTRDRGFSDAHLPASVLSVSHNALRTEAERLFGKQYDLRERETAGEGSTQMYVSLHN